MLSVIINLRVINGVLPAIDRRIMKLISLLCFRRVTDIGQISIKMMIFYRRCLRFDKPTGSFGMSLKIMERWGASSHYLLFGCMLGFCFRFSDILECNNRPRFDLDLCRNGTLLNHLVECHSIMISSSGVVALGLGSPIYPILSSG